MSGTNFTFTQYGQDRLVMDWFALQDPFQQSVPIKITNNWSGTLWFQGQLNSGASGILGWYASGASYSGIPLPSSSAGSGIAAGASDTVVMTWTVSVSGQPIASSSPVTDNIIIQLNAYISGTLAAAALFDTAILSGLNVLYNRYSGVIKVFGDNYSNDVPIVSITPLAATNRSGTFSYAVSYFLSGWESDIGAPTAVAIASGFATLALSWAGTAGVTQYNVWRWSGATDFSIYSGGVLSGVIDLIGIVSGTSLTDNAISPLQTGVYRHRSWNIGSFDGTTYLSPPDSISVNANTIAYHTYKLDKNISGVSLLGPFYVTMHRRGVESAGINGELRLGQTFIDNTSGSNIIDSTGLSRISSTNWYRYGIYISGASVTTTCSGKAIIQWAFNVGVGNTMRLDDVYIVANS